MTATNEKEHEHERRGRAWERRGLLIGIIVAVVGVVVAVIGSGVGVWGIYDARDNREKLVQSQEQIKDAIMAKNNAETRANELSTENAKLQNVNIDQLLEQYARHLSAINNAASRYDELRKLPDTSDTIPQKAAAQRQLNDEVAAIVPVCQRCVRTVRREVARLPGDFGQNPRWQRSTHG